MRTLSSPVPLNNQQMPFKLVQINGSYPGRVYHIPAITDTDGIQRALLGRNAPDHVVEVSIEEPMVSRKHAGLVFDGESLYVEHLSQSNPSFVNDKLLSTGEKRYLKLDDVIRLADIYLRLAV